MFEIPFFSEICTQPIFYHQSKFQSLKLERNSLMIFFTKLLVFHLHKIDCKTSVESFFLCFCFFLLLLISNSNDFIFRLKLLHCLKTVMFFIQNDFQRCISWCNFVEIMVSSPTKKKLKEDGMLVKFVRSIQQKVEQSFCLQIFENISGR